jgi:hypothetical protein
MFPLGKDEFRFTNKGKKDLVERQLELATDIG